MSEVRVDFFEVIIPFENIRSFSTSLHLLQKVGKEVTVDIEDLTLTLRALNDLKSSFASIEFSEHFFESFLISETYKAFSCKLAVKPVCSIFRNIKNVRSIKLTASVVGADHELAFQMNISNGITRTHRFRYSDCEIMNALFEEDDCSYVRAKPKVFAQILDHLHNSPKVAVETSATTFSVRSFHKTNIGGAAMSLQQRQQELKRHMTTGLSVSMQEFEEYQFRPMGALEEEGGQSVVELIFCLREVNSFLGFCEALDLPDFDFFFSLGGRAIKFSCKCDNVNVALVLATIESQNSRLMQQQPQAGAQQQYGTRQEDPDQSGDVLLHDESVLVNRQIRQQDEADDRTVTSFAANPQEVAQRRDESRHRTSAFVRLEETMEEQEEVFHHPPTTSVSHKAALGGSRSNGDVVPAQPAASPAQQQDKVKPPMNRRKRLFEESSDDE